MDIKRAVVTGHTNGCVIEPSKFGTLHTYSLESSWMAEVSIDERSGECKVTDDKAWHQRYVCEIANASLES